MREDERRARGGTPAGAGGAQGLTRTATSVTLVIVCWSIGHAFFLILVARLFHLSSILTHIAFLLCILSAVGVIFCSRIVALLGFSGDRSTWLRRYGTYGEALWSFSNLWFVVLLVGLYSSAISAFTRWVTSGAAADVAGILSYAARDFILAGFLAVLTSVISNTFQSIQNAGSNLDVVSDRAGDMIERSQAVTSTLETQIDRAVKQLRANVGGLRTAKLMNDLGHAAAALHDEDRGPEPLAASVDSMCEDVTSFHEVALVPLLAPSMPRTDDVAADVAQLPGWMAEPANEGDRPHFAYMSAAIGRYFEAECQERAFPGVLFQVTSFACYVTTIAAIVRAMEPWWGQYEFYTLMPERPIGLFRFSNSTDFREWIDFLDYFQDFQAKDRGIWRRYFAFAKDPGLSVVTRFLHGTDTFWRDLQHGAIVTDATDAQVEYATRRGRGWHSPRRLHEADMVPGEDKILSTAHMSHEDIESAKRENPLQEDLPGMPAVGTLAARLTSHAFPFDQGNHHWRACADKGWRPLEDVLYEYHGAVEPEERNRAEDRFAYRCMDPVLLRDDVFARAIEVIGTGRYGHKPRRRHLKLPRDFFAIKRKGGPWVFLIGRDEGGLGGGASHAHLALAPVLDLATMGLAASGDTNQRSAKRIQLALDDIFADYDGEHVLRHSEFREKYRPPGD